MDNIRITDLAKIIENVSQPVEGRIEKDEDHLEKIWDYIFFPCKKLYNETRYAYNDVNTIYDEDKFIGAPVYFHI